MRKTARIVLGLLFVFSGFVKAVDPIGFALILTEYFRAFHLMFLEPLALMGAVALSAVEFVLGIMLLLDFRKQITAWGIFLFMSFFTLLTLYLALFNPIEDCGCFGEAITLTNWQTFFKNLVFLPLSLVVFLQRNRTFPVARARAEWSVCVFFTILITSISIYSYRHLPFVDFRGFKIGNDLPLLLEEARTQPEFIYKTELLYSKDGKQKTFEPDAFPDSSWTFVAAHTKEIRTGVRHKLRDFSVFDTGGEEMTDALLQENQTALLLLVTSYENLTNRILEQIKPLVAERKAKDTPVYAISALPAEELRELLLTHGLEMPVYMTDRNTLLTMIRSTPGLMVLKQGTVMAKYGFRDIPTLKQWKKMIEEDPELVVARATIQMRLRVQLFVAALLLLVFLLRKGFWFTRAIRFF
ncbi:MAG: DoxX family protein [Bacteroidales bacterium]|nr:DoxX family protein [Bacteroidales bacterium]